MLLILPLIAALIILTLLLLASEREAEVEILERIQKRFPLPPKGEEDGN